MPQALASLCYRDMLNFFWFLTKWGGGTNGVCVIPRCEVGQCQECSSSRSVLLFDWDETEATLMLLLDSVPSQVSAEQCARNASRAACERTVPWLIKCVVVSNKCFKLACAGTASAVQPWHFAWGNTGLRCARSTWQIPSSEFWKSRRATCRIREVPVVMTPLSLTWPVTSLPAFLAVMRWVPAGGCF